ncbi:MAG: TetM/TetW/TetO/TetS family tetracycline resistance ribosomal protection protein [Clostridia bacterium]|nr:TetM/TetW/TetO/TetS family tetracycline resistance ribosomal protection protein [Clostridia bacterium]
MAGKGSVIGLSAHVDAGKTTLSESLLFLSGAVRRQGRVDHGDAFLDTERMEKERGITIFSKQAVLTWNKKEITLMDTPGHTDFSGETERVMGVLDACVLVISAVDGVQSHTRTLWKLLERFDVPVFLFVNKMDRFQGDKNALLSALQKQLSEAVVDFNDRDDEKLALCDEVALDYYLKEGSVPDYRVRQLIRQRRLFPCYFGSALRNEGVEALLNALAEFDPETNYPSEFGARVYKVARDPQGARLTFLKVTGGVLKVRDLLSLKDESGEILWAEKAAELRQYSGAKYTPVQQAEAGSLCCVVGLSKTAPGDGLGAEKAGKEAYIQPCYSCRLVIRDQTDIHHALDYLRTLEEEEPLMRVEYVEQKREIHIQSMGDVYLEVLKRQCQDRFGMDIDFADESVLYRETISGPVEGVGHYEPLRHYAEVHLLLTPGKRGSGMSFSSAVSLDDLAVNWQRLIMTHLKEKVHVGVLTGSPITDMKITLVSGKAHLKHTEGGDFRQATYRAIRQGLMKAESVLLEPYLNLELTLPEENLGRAMTDLTAMGGEFEAPETAPDGLLVLRALAPASKCASYGKQVSIYTKGRGRMTAEFAAYLPCADAEAVIAAKAYDPRADLYNSPDSIFCSHGAGFDVPWDQVDAYAHLPLLKEVREQAAREMDAVPKAPVRYQGTAKEDEELMAIFERTYGPVKSRQLFAPVKPSLQSAAPAAPGVSPQREVLLVDGYNIIFAWEELKALAKDNLQAARQQLMDILCNYSGVTGKDVILVFDAYRVPGNAGSVEKYLNIFVCYTKEAQTADAFIEKTTYEAKGTPRIRVATSDGPEQTIVLGNRALRVSAREFEREVEGVQGSIAAFLEKNNRIHAAPALETAYKAAWKQKKQGEAEKT